MVSLDFPQILQFSKNISKTLGYRQILYRDIYDIRCEIFFETPSCSPREQEVTEDRGPRVKSTESPPRCEQGRTGLAALPPEKEEHLERERELEEDICEPSSTVSFPAHLVVGWEVAISGHCSTELRWFSKYRDWNQLLIWSFLVGSRGQPALARQHSE